MTNFIQYLKTYAVPAFVHAGVAFIILFFLQGSFDTSEVAPTGFTLFLLLVILYAAIVLPALQMKRSLFRKNVTGDIMLFGLILTVVLTTRFLTNALLSTGYAVTPTDLKIAAIYAAVTMFMPTFFKYTT